MTVSSLVGKVQRAGNGTTTRFDFPYLFFAPADLVVTLFDTTRNQPVAPAPVLNGGGAADYHLDGTLDAASGEYLAGATVVFNVAPSGGITVTIERAVPATQPVALTDNSKFPASAVNGALDRLTVLAQQAAGSLARTLQAPTSDPAGLNLTLPPAAVRAGKSLGFDAGGGVVAVAPFGSWRGDWASGTVYAADDVGRDGAAGANTGSIYYCLLPHTATTWSADLAAGRWQLAINVGAVHSDRLAADEAARQTAEDRIAVADSRQAVDVAAARIADDRVAVHDDRQAVAAAAAQVSDDRVAVHDDRLAVDTAARQVADDHIAIHDDRQAVDNSALIASQKADAALASQTAAGISATSAASQATAARAERLLADTDAATAQAAAVTATGAAASLAGQLAGITAWPWRVPAGTTMQVTALSAVCLVLIIEADAAVQIAADASLTV